MLASLRIKSGSAETVYSCGKVTTIGRVETNDVLLSDPKVSRSHALLRILGDGKYYLIDLGSANGTFVNGKRLIAPSVLNNADVIKIGDNMLTFDFQQNPGDSVNESDASARTTILATGHVVQRATILVLDIRGFTALSEQVSPSFLAAVVGCWFRSAGEITDKNHGEVDKYTGDGVMIRWMADMRTKDQSVIAALRTTHEMNLATTALAKDFPDLPAPLQIGAGINTGVAALGMVGAGMGRDYTALGDAVNLAFRFQEATKALKTDVVIGPDAWKHLPDEFTKDRLHTITVKGKDAPITVCAIKREELASCL